MNMLLWGVSYVGMREEQEFLKVAEKSKLKDFEHS